MVEREKPDMFTPIDVEEAVVALDTAEAFTGTGHPKIGCALAEMTFRRICADEESVDNPEATFILNRAREVGLESYVSFPKPRPRMNGFLVMAQDHLREGRIYWDTPKGISDDWNERLPADADPGEIEGAKLVEVCQLSAVRCLQRDDHVNALKVARMACEQLDRLPRVRFFPGFQHAHIEGRYLAVAAWQELPEKEMWGAFDEKDDFIKLAMIALDRSVDEPGSAE